MDTKTRANLRGIASKETSIVQIGKDGLTSAVLSAIKECLDARELVKISVLKTCENAVKELGQEIADKLKCELLTCIGQKIVIYKKSSKVGVKHVLEAEKTITDPRIKPNQNRATNFKGEHFAAENERRERMKKTNKVKNDNKSEQSVKKGRKEVRKSNKEK